jgi:uncharacterized protein
MPDAIWLIVGLLFVAGLIGALFPFLPGTPLILLGALVYAAATGFTVIGMGRLVILAVIAAAAYVLGHVTAALGAKRSGGSGWAVVGALVGGLLGVIVFPLGVLIGSIVGAVVAEYLSAGDLERSLRSGVGALIGIAVGAVAHFALALLMIALFFWWTWPFR